VTKRWCVIILTAMGIQVKGMGGVLCRRVGAGLSAWRGGIRNGRAASMGPGAGGRTLAAALLLLAAVLLAAPAAAERPFPRPDGPVNDFAGVLSPEERQRLDALTREVFEKTGVAVVVATFPDIGGAEYNDYVNRLYAAWGIGKKGEDKGVLIFVTIQERKMRIETGYGVEGVLPDGLVGEIRDRYMLPYFREDRFGAGLLNGTLAVAKVLADDAGVTLTGTPEPKASARREEGVPFWPFLIFILIFWTIVRSGSRSRGAALPWIAGAPRGGGIGSGGFGGFSGGFGGFGGGMSGGGGAGGGF